MSRQGELMGPITVLGRAWAVGVLTVGFMTGGLAHALAADLSFVEREHRSQQVVVVKPDGTDQTSEAEKPPDKIAELKRAIREEERRRDLLGLKLNALRERVKVECTKVQAGPLSVSTSGHPRIVKAASSSRVTINFGRNKPLEKEGERQLAAPRPNGPMPFRAPWVREIQPVETSALLVR